MCHIATHPYVCVVFILQALVHKFGEPIADHYDADVEQLFMDAQVRWQLGFVHLIATQDTKQVAGTTQFLGGRCSRCTAAKPKESCSC